MTNTLVLGGVLAASSLMSSAALAGALTGNVGVMSDYFFRGVDQRTSATANAGVDYDLGNKMTVGAWAADMVDGLEVDLYGAYADKINQFDYSIGFTTYQYTGDFFDNASEINLNVSTGPVSLEYSVGSIDSSPSADYTFLALTFTKGNAYGTYGTFGSDVDGSYIEVGYGMEMNGMDVGIAIISADDDLSIVDEDGDGNTDAEISMALTLSKSFNIN
jgi:uncharacterized protein (TIGR02001 family)